jgi:type I restriction enzyme, S subunit
MDSNQAKTLPSGWRTARVADVLTVRNGYAVKSSEYCEDGVPLIRQSDIDSDTIDISGAKRVSTRVMEECSNYLVREGDLLIGMSGSLGKIGRYPNKEPAVQNQRTGLLLLKPGFSAGFAKLVLKFVEPQIIAEGKGVAVQNVSAKEIEACTFPLPPTEERDRMVAEIEKQFTRLDAGVASLKWVESTLKRYRAALLKAACEGRLVPTEAELARKESSSYETGEELLKRILTQRRQNWNGRGKYKEPAAPDIVNSPELPEGWTWTSVGQLVIEPLCNGVSVKGSDNPPGVRALRLSAMSDSGFDYSDARYLPLPKSEVDDLWIREGDFFVSRGNGSLHLVGRDKRTKAAAADNFS